MVFYQSLYMHNTEKEYTVHHNTIENDTEISTHEFEKILSIKDIKKLEIQEFKKINS